MTHETERFTFDISFFVVFMWTLLVVGCSVCRLCMPVGVCHSISDCYLSGLYASDCSKCVVSLYLLELYVFDL
jgi:hypothetical protein